MQEPPFLTDDEIRMIVTPLTQPAAMLRWFRQNGFKEVRQKPNGMPLLSRAYFDQVMGVTASKNMPAPSGPGPDVEGYLARFAERRAKRNKRS